MIWNEDGSIDLNTIEADLDKFKKRAVELRPYVHSGTGTVGQMIEARVCIGVIEAFQPGWGR